ncbi:MAG: hypothetical protein GY868_11005, partial [Deltaproteobacteria bacterium]|nr:hypothetical protein [Deltaproteobacteria bacterium]
MMRRSPVCLRMLTGVFTAFLLVVPAVLFAGEAEESAAVSGITCEAGALTIDAREMRPEDVLKDIGVKCGIKVVVFGEVFSEVPISIKLKKMPVRKAIERVLRMTNISNYLMHFED